MMPQSSTTSAHVLVVDDDRAMCQLLVDLLRDEGYSVDVAHDGESSANGQAVAI